MQCLALYRQTVVLAQGLSMRHSITAILAAAVFSLLPGRAAFAQQDEGLKLQDNPPDRYVVVKGDTLWGISKRYLQNPWKWPDLWGMNKDEVANPHLIYPGDVLILDLSGGTARLRKEGTGLAEAGRGSAVNSTVKLSPKVRTAPVSSAAIPSISSSVIGPFLNRPLIVDKDTFEASPRVVATQENRVLVGAGDSAFVKGIDADAPPVWQVYRATKPLYDPGTKELLGNEVLYLGDARVTEIGEVSTVRVLRARQEIGVGDRLVMAPPSDILSYSPHAVRGDFSGTVISATENVVSEIGQQQVVVLNRGVRDGVEIGHVVALYRQGRDVVPRRLPSSASNDPARKEIRSVYSEYDPTKAGEPVRTPDQRYGLAFVFRVFDRVSYALVMNTSRSVNLGDAVRAP
jgi:LysM repeat protein